MYLLIDNSEDEKISLHYCLNTKWVQAVFEIKKVKNLLNAIDKLFKKIGIKPRDLRGVAVVVGKGRFTSTRVATTVANMFGYTLDIPVVAVERVNNLKSIFSGAKIGQYVSAKYSAEANIGKKKK